MKELKVLLENNFITKEDNRELFYQIKDNYKQFKPFIVDKLGYELIIRTDFIRLEKRPGVAEEWMGIEGFEDKQEYIFFMLLIMFLEDKNKEDQFLLSHITEFLASQGIGEAVDWTQYRVRRSLIKVLKAALEQGLIRITDGREDDFIQNAEREVLFESTGLSRYLVRTFHQNIDKIKSYRDLEVPQEELIDVERGTTRKNRVYRKLLLSPIVYQDEKDDEDYAYIKNYHHIIEEDFRKYLGWTFQLHRNGALVIPGQQDKTKFVFPNTSALSDIILHFNALIREQLQSGSLHRTAEDTIKLTQKEFKDLVQLLISQKLEGWSKEYREASLERTEFILMEEMKRYKMIKIRADEIILLPLVGKLIGDYPEDYYTGGGKDE